MRKIGTLLVVAALSFALSPIPAAGLPQDGFETHYFSDCHTEVGYSGTLCSGHQEEWGTLDGVWKEEITFGCQNGDYIENWYYKCGNTWVRVSGPCPYYMPC